MQKAKINNYILLTKNMSAEYCVSQFCHLNSFKNVLNISSSHTIIQCEGEFALISTD